MAIGQSIRLPQRRDPVDVAAWTSQAAEQLADLTLAPDLDRTVRGTSVQVDISLDEEQPRNRPVKVLTRSARARSEDDEDADSGEYNKAYGKRTLMRRDSLKRREALLKGKEGSRRRQRWENDRLLSNPYAQPPLPTDWEVHPTHPVHTVPYYLAPLWDAGIKARYTERGNRASKTSASDAMPPAASAVARDLRERLKRARGAKALLVDLEQEVRRFVETWNERGSGHTQSELSDPDSEDDDVVFVGRNGEMRDMTPSPRASREYMEPEKLVFDSLESDHGANFGRWLVHSIGQYYGLSTWSITVGDPARREAYVGINETRLKSGRDRAPPALPRPLYGLV